MGVRGRRPLKERFAVLLWSVMVVLHGDESFLDFFTQSYLAKADAITCIASMLLAGFTYFLFVPSPYYIIMGSLSVAHLAWIHRGRMSYVRQRRRVVLGLRLVRLNGILNAFRKMRAGATPIMTAPGAAALAAPMSFAAKQLLLLTNTTFGLLFTLGFALDTPLQVPMVLLFAGLATVIAHPMACTHLKQAPFSGAVARMHHTATWLATWPHAERAASISEQLCLQPSDCCYQVSNGLQLYLGVLLPTYVQLAVELHYKGMYYYLRYKQYQHREHAAALVNTRDKDVCEQQQQQWDASSSDAAGASKGSDGSDDCSCSSSSGGGAGVGAAGAPSAGGGGVRNRTDSGGSGNAGGGRDWRRLKAVVGALDPLWNTLWHAFVLLLMLVVAWNVTLSIALARTRSAASPGSASSSASLIATPQ